MNGHDYVAGLAEEYRNATGLGQKAKAAEVLDEISRVADQVGENQWVPKAGLQDDLTVEGEPAADVEVDPEPAK